VIGGTVRAARSPGPGIPQPDHDVPARGTSIEQRVARAAGAAVQDQGYVSPVDVLVGMGWLPQVLCDHWRQGRVPYLEQVVQAGAGKVSAAMRALPRWAREHGLQPSETAYVARTRDRRTLQFSASGDPSVERAYRTHWVSPALSEAERARVVERAGRPADLVVVSPLKDWTCAKCGATGGLLFMEDDAPLCLACADLDHLVHLPAGDAALTRRARRASGLSAVVVRFSRSRKRYERQGVLVEEQALAEAESSCLADAEARARRRARDEERRREADSGGPERSGACSPGAHRNAPPRSPPTPRRGAAGGSVAPPRAGTWTRARSSSQWSPPSGTTALITTRCS
jgi:hypothetical protein